MSLVASVIVDEVGTMLNDMPDHVRWPVPELLGYLTEGIAAVAQVKPSTFVVVTTLLLQPGPTQLVPEEYSRLLDVHFNFERDGVTAGPNVLPGVYALQQAFQKPSCPPNGVIETYSAYPSSERYFFVNPPVSSNLGYTPKIEALVQVAPVPVIAESQPIFMPGTAPQLYRAALVDWCLYRAYGKDQESQSSWERSQGHLKAFAMYTGMSVEASQKTVKSSGAAPVPARRAA